MLRELDDLTRHSVLQLVRFLIVGGANTLLSYTIFTVLGLVIEPWIAYTIAFAVGLAWTSLLSSRFVFRVRFSPSRVLLFVCCYLVIYGIGSVIIRLLDPQTLQDLLITSLIMLITTTPLVFMVGRFIFNWNATVRPSLETSEERQL